MAVSVSTTDGAGTDETGVEAAAATSIVVSMGVNASTEGAITELGITGVTGAEGGFEVAGEELTLLPPLPPGETCPLAIFADSAFLAKPKSGFIGRGAMVAFAVTAFLGRPRGRPSTLMSDGILNRNGLTSSCSATVGSMPKGGVAIAKEDKVGFKSGVKATVADVVDPLGVNDENVLGIEL